MIKADASLLQVFSALSVFVFVFYAHFINEISYDLVDSLVHSPILTDSIAEIKLDLRFFHIIEDCPRLTA